MSPSGFDNEGNENRRLATGEAEAIFSSFGLTESSLTEQRPFTEELRDLAARLGDERYGIEARICLAMLGGYDGDIIPDLRDAAGAARRIGSVQLEALARVMITDTLEGRGEHEAAIRAGRDDLAPGEPAGPGPVCDGADRGKPGRVADVGGPLGRSA